MSSAVFYSGFTVMTTGTSCIWHWASPDLFTWEATPVAPPTTKTLTSTANIDAFRGTVHTITVLSEDADEMKFSRQRFLVNI